MKKALFCIVLIAIVTSLCACTIPFPMPEDGIWYCEELGITLVFEYETPVSGRWYFSDTEYKDLEIGSPPGNFVRIYYCEEHEPFRKFRIYSGKCTYENNILTFHLSGILNPSDIEGDMISVEGVEYTFVEIDSYDDVKTPNENNIIKYFFQ